MDRRMSWLKTMGSKELDKTDQLNNKQGGVWEESEWRKVVLKWKLVEQIMQIVS